MARIKIEGLKTNTSYKFYVVAKDNNGIESAPSNIYTFTTDYDITAPDMISNLQADFSTNTFTASWDGPDISNTPDFLDYKITIAKPSGVTYQTFNTINKSFAFTLEQNRAFFGLATPSPSITISVASRDTSGNISSSSALTAANAAPTESPVIITASILKGFSASWAAVAASFVDYSYTQVNYSTDRLFATSTDVWTGNNTYMEYSGFTSYSPIYIRARHVDIFNQAGPYGNTGSVTPIAPIVVDTVAPSNATGLTVTASNSGGANGMSGYIVARWNESIDTTLRGARLRVRAQGDAFYQYENLAASVSGTGSYQIGNLIPGFVYEVAIASYDEINNTSSFTISSPSAIVIPFGVPASEYITASAAASSSIVALSSTVSGSMIGQIIAGYGLVSGTRITGSFTGSVSITPNTASVFSSSIVSLYKGMANWQSYVTAGASMRFGTGINGTQHGIWLDNNNYWYTTGNLRVGSNTSFIGWDGQTASITGDITAKSGSFDGNIFITSSGTLVAASSLTGARVLLNRNGIIAYNSSGINTFTLDAGNGNIGASAGVIGGWNITSASLYAGTGASTVGLALPSSSTDIAIWAGSAIKTGAPFRVAANGAASMSNAYVAGSIIFTAGYVGNWTVDSTSLYNASVGFYAPNSPAVTEIAIFAGSSVASRATAPFRVSYNGGASMTSAYVSGTVIASTGSIGGWSLAADRLTAGTGATEVAMSTGATSFWAGSTSGAAPFRVTNTGALTSTSGQIGGFSIGASSLNITTGTAGNTVAVYMNATASTSNAGNYPFQVETNTVSGTSSLSTYVRTQLAYSACVTTLNTVPQKITWIKLGTASPGWARENILQLFSIIPTKYIAEDGSTITFDPLYDGYTGMVWRNGNTVGGSYTYLVNSPTGNTYLDSNQGSIYIRPQAYSFLTGISYHGAGGTIGTPATASSLYFDIPAAGGTANTNIVYSLCSDGRYRYNIRLITSSLKAKTLIDYYEIDKQDFMSIKPRLFSWKEDSESRPRGGFILEEVAEIQSMRPFINLNPSGEDQSLDYGGMVAMLVDVVQKQQSQIDNLTASFLFLVNK